MNEPCIYPLRLVYKGTPVYTRLFRRAYNKDWRYFFKSDESVEAADGRPGAAAYN